MMMAAAAKKRLGLIGLNLWQSGVRSLFKYYMYRSGKTQDEAWADIRADMEPRCPNSQEWEFQQIRAVLYEELNITVEIGEEMYSRYPDSTPLIDAMRSCLNKIDK